MTFKEKIEKIEYTFDLDKRKFEKLIDVQFDVDDPKKEALEAIQNIFNISSYVLMDENESLPSLEMHYKIDFDKYKNIFASYSALLKENYGKDSHIFVLSKIKRKTGLKGIMSSIFNDDKEFKVDKLENFSPSYLVKNKRGSFLVNFDGGFFNAYEIQIKKEAKTFEHREYNYRIANEIKIK